MSKEHETIRVALGARTYVVHVGPGLLGDTSLLATGIGAGRVLVVTDETVAPLYLDRVEKNLGGYRPDRLVLPDGESAKTLESMARIIDRLAEGGCRRDATLVALGGGVIGDLVGFAAACYMRGIGFLQIPTTLLAQVDASVGGKTGVNHPAGKNLMGAFHQPRAVVADTTTLTTLPEREYRAGLAEVVKASMIRDDGFFEWLESTQGQLARREEPALTGAITRAVRLKADIVADDERETGARALLNLGHTFAHALETTTGYRRWLHGEAVAIGLAQASRLAVRLGRCDPVRADRVIALLGSLGLETRIPGDLEPATLIRAMRLDKKATAAGLRLVLPDDARGAVVADDVPDADILAVLSDDATA